MSEGFDYEIEDDAVAEWLEQWAKEDEANMDYDEQYELQREEMREEMEYHKQSQQDAADDAAAARMKASVCPVCGEEVGEADYEDADPSVGIMGGVYCNYCPTHGEFYTYDDATQEMEEKS